MAEPCLLDVDGLEHGGGVLQVLLQVHHGGFSAFQLLHQTSQPEDKSGEKKRCQGSFTPRTITTGTRIAMRASPMMSVFLSFMQLGNKVSLKVIPKTHHRHCHISVEDSTIQLERLVQ